MRDAFFVPVTPVPPSAPAPQGPAASTRQVVEAVRALAEPVAERHGCRVVAVEFFGGAGRGVRILRVSIDRPGGATVGECERVSRQLSPAVDAADLIPTAFDLEVSTPGIDRPVQSEEDFAWFTGCEVRVKTWGMDGRRRLKGTIRGVEAGVLSLEVEGELRQIPVADVERANLVLDLEQFARLGEGLHPLAPAPVQEKKRVQGKKAAAAAYAARQSGESS